MPIPCSTKMEILFKIEPDDGSPPHVTKAQTENDLHSKDEIQDSIIVDHNQSSRVSKRRRLDTTGNTSYLQPESVSGDEVRVYLLPEKNIINRKDLVSLDDIPKAKSAPKKKTSSAFSAAKQDITTKESSHQSISSNSLTRGQDTVVGGSPTDRYNGFELRFSNTRNSRWRQTH